MEKQVIDKQLIILEDELAKQKIVSNRYSIFRLFLLVSSIVCLYYGTFHSSWFYFLMVIGVFLFFWFVALHMKVRKEIELKESLIITYQDMKDRKSDAWKSFIDCGSDFLNDENTQAFDLDIFGNASLFQYLSVAKSVLGREALAHLLSVQTQDHQIILKRQVAIKELVEKTEFTTLMVSLLKLFERHGRKKKKASWNDFYDYMEQAQHFYHPFFRFFITVLSLSTLLSLGSVIVFQTTYIVTMVLAVTSIGLACLLLIRNSQAFTDVAQLSNTMQDFERIFQVIEQVDFEASHLNSIKEQLKEATIAIRKLRRITNVLQLRKDGIMFLMVNAFFLIDFQCTFALEKWKKAYGKEMRKWMRMLAQLEALLSMAQLSYAKDKICTPKLIEKDTPYIHMERIYHPLICEECAIGNSFDTIAHSYIITGSNMSGKTTFLRTIGLNMVLFHAGGEVCADVFCANSMDVYTSMRIKDDVSEGISTFYAEILRIKQMIENSKEKNNMLVLIDEIFKGTNSADRIVCAKEVLQQLHLPWVTSLVSTHDFELCSLAFKDQTSTQNYHFSEYYESGCLKFDYQLKEGKCKTTNAKELLKMAGIM